MKKCLLIIVLFLPVLARAQYTLQRLDSLIHAAADANLASVTIPPGEYRGNTGGIWLQNASDLHIIANGVKMICEKRTRALEFTNCSNITLEGLTIDYDTLTFTQGDIVAVGADYVDVKIHQGYPVKAWSRMDVIDPVTRYRKRGTIFAWNNTAQILGGDTVRVTNTDSPNITSVAEVGDMASLSTGPEGPYGAPHALVLTDCQGGMALKNVTIHCGPGFGIYESGGMGGTHLDSCKVIPGPRPPGATEDRLLSVSWDAIQHKLTRTGPLMENCIIKDAGDDSWSVTWDGDYTITSGGGTTITVNRDNLQVGDSLRASLYSDVVYITAKTGSTLTLNKNCPWPAGTRLYSPSRRCEHFIVRNNYIHSPGRVLVKAGHGLIENNIFDNTHAGVNVHTELGEGGATGISNIVIRNNEIIGTGHFMSAWWSVEAGAISVLDAGDSLSAAGRLDSIYIANNRFTDVSGVNIVVASATNVQIKENDFYSTGMSTPNQTGGQYGIPQQTVVYLKHLQNVTLDSNVVHSSGLARLLDTVYISNLYMLRRGIFDTDGPAPQQYDNVTPYCCNNTGGNAFDGNTATFVDADAANGAYTGINYQLPVTLDSIRFYPRPGFEYRMNGGKFQGSDDGVNYTDIYTITTNPSAGWTAVNVSADYQYLRYLSPDGGFCNVAEIVFVQAEDNALLPPAFRNHSKAPAHALKAYPNPVTHMLYLAGLAGIEGDCRLTLTDFSGRVIFSRQLPEAEKTGLYKLDMAQCGKGIYLLTIQSPGRTTSKKIIKL